MKAELSARSALLVLGCLLCQMGAGYFYATRALAPDVIEDLGWTRTMWSSGVAPMLLVSSTAQAFVGAAVVRFGVRPVVVTAILMLGGSVVALSTMQTLAQFYVAMVLLALGTAGIGDVSIGGVITRWFDRYRSVALGFAMIGTNIGAVVFVHAISNFSGDPSASSWRESAMTVGLCGFALILPFALFAVRDPRPGEGLLSEVAGPEQAAVPGRVETRMREAIRRPAFWALFYVLFCYSFVQLGLYDHLVLYLTDVGYSRAEAAGALELAVGAGILAKLGAGFLVLFVRPRTAFLANTLLLALGIGIVPFAGHAGMLTLFGLLFGLSTAARDVLLPIVVAEMFGVRYFAQVYGVMMLAFIPGGVLGPIVLARVYDLVGNYHPGFNGGLALVLVAVVAMIVLARRPIHGNASALGAA